MANLERRLKRLETITPVTLSAREVSYLQWLSTPSLVTVALQVAKDRAQRRVLHERGVRHWYSLSDDEREDLVRAELATLRSWDALHAWCDEPDSAGWPALSYPTNATSFQRRLAHHRAMLAVHRSANAPLGRAWRRAHPEWCRDMSPEAYDAWEHWLLDHTGSRNG